MNGARTYSKLSAAAALPLICALAVFPFTNHAPSRAAGRDPADAAGTPIDAAQFFVRQHYLDFLGREPDPAGLAFWTGEIESCGADQQCREVRRVNVSAAFFLSIEFQETGYLVYRIHKAAFGDLPGHPVPVRREGFTTETRAISSGVIVNTPGWEQVLESNKNAFVLAYVGRGDFQEVFPPSMSPADFVDKLDRNAGGVLDAAESANLVNELTTNNTDAGRASVLRKVAEDADLHRREFNHAFVLMQYFGYLRRDPDAVGFDGQADPEFLGYHFWLDKLEQFHGNFVEAEMVKAFISSIEYRRRFEEGGLTVLRAFSDLNQMPSVDDTRKTMEQWETTFKLIPAPMCQAMSPAEALASVRSLLESQASRAALDALAESPEGRDARKASLAAAAALLARKPAAALAALLRAHELEPQSPAHLANLAGFMSAIGWACEALVLFDAADARGGVTTSPMGTSGQAAALNGRGLSLLHLKRYEEAAAVLRRAVELEPLLAEAKSNLALALWMQGKQELGMLYQRAGMRRTIGNSDLAEGLPSGDTSLKPPPPFPEKIRLDLSAGKELTLPDYHLPTTLEQYLAMRPAYESLLRSISARWDAHIMRMEWLREQNTQRLIRSPRHVVLYTTYVEDYVNERRFVKHPQLIYLAERWQTAALNGDGGFWDAWLKELDRLHEMEKAETSACKGDQDCWAAVKKRYNQLRCEGGRQYFSNYSAVARACDGAFRAYMPQAYRHATAVAANLNDPIAHELVQLEAEVYVFHELTTLFGHCLIRPYQIFPWREWCNSSTETGRAVDGVDLAKSDPCPAALQGRSLSIDLQVFALSFDCEKIGLEMSTPGWFGYFATVEYGVGGNITVFAGGKFSPKVGPIGAEVKAGIYFKGNFSGQATLNDVGYMFSTSVSLGSGPIGLSADTGTTEVSFVSALSN